MEEPDRYSRQIIFPGLGAEGQRRLGSSFAVVVGLGALGGVSASALVRAGVGRVRLIDRDFVERHNLQRQLLYTERDIEEDLPKAVAAERRLREANSGVEVEGVVADLHQVNAERLLEGADVIVDGLDNFEARFLLSDVSLKLGIPWVYGGAIQASGMTATFLPHEKPCFRCLVESPPARGGLTCDTGGVISAAPWTVGSLQAAEAIKILAGTAPVSRELVVFDLWRRSFETLPLESFVSPACPSCQGDYEYLKEDRPGPRFTHLCGQDAVQVWDPGAIGAPPAELKDRLRLVGAVEGSERMLRFAVGEQELVVFPDGRTIVRGTRDEELARALYAKYLGM
jgi:molybdopterin/thiamine biosynthesis adenylyltransferase